LNTSRLSQCLPQDRKKSKITLGVDEKEEKRGKVIERRRRSLEEGGTDLSQETNDGAHNDAQRTTNKTFNVHEDFVSE
jgi:hypothetical protein